jgi:hypothetical protein
MNKKITSLISLFFLLLSGCAPEIGLSLPVPSLPEPELSVDSMETSAGVKVRVGKFVDSRPEQTVVVIDGRKADSEGDLPRVVEQGFEQYLRRVGARIAVLNAPTIEGKIVDWIATIQPGFPASEGQAVARLKVTLHDSRGHPIYHATFSGESTTSHPMLGTSEVQKLLTQAMSSAIEVAVKDEDFIAQLSKGRIS